MQEGWSLYEKPWEGVGTENCESYLQKVTILPKVFKYGPSIILGYKPNIIRGKILVPFLWLSRYGIFEGDDWAGNFLFWYLFMINMLVTVLSCGIIVSNPTTAFKGTRELCWPYLSSTSKIRSIPQMIP